MKKIIFSQLVFCVCMLNAYDLMEFSNKSFEETYQDNKKYCDEGDFESCVNIVGSANFYAFELKHNDKIKYKLKEYVAKAKQLSQKECISGNWDKCEQVAFLYARGIGVTRDFDAAVNALYDGCLKGENSNSCIKIANLLDIAKNNENFNFDEIKVLGYIKTACKKKIFNACAKLGSVYFYGDIEGVQVDYKIARLYYERACKIESNSNFCKKAEMLKEKGY